MATFEGLLCEVCNKEFDDENLPIKTSCGHIPCETCLKTRKLQKCITCGSQIPANRRNIIYGFTFPKQSPVTSVDNELEDLKKELTSQKENLILKSKKLVAKEKNLDSKLERIEELMLAAEFVDDSSVSESVKDIKGDVCYTQKFKFVPKAFPTPADDPVSFLKELYKKIKSGVEVMTFHRTDNDTNEIKFGQIFIWSDLLYFQSLELDIPRDCKEFIRFRDLKDMLSGGTTFEIHHFLKVSCQDIDKLIMIKLLSSILSPQVDCLFTGELGLSYTGSLVSKMYNGFKITLDKSKFEKALKNAVYYINICKQNTFNPGYYVTIDAHGNLVIFNGDLTPPKNAWAVGAVKSPEDLFQSNIPDGKVTACGISVKIVF